MDKMKSLDRLKEGNFWICCKKKVCKIELNFCHLVYKVNPGKRFSVFVSVSIHSQFIVELIIIFMEN